MSTLKAKAKAEGRQQEEECPKTLWAFTLSSWGHACHCPMKQSRTEQSKSIFQARKSLIPLLSPQLSSAIPPAKNESIQGSHSIWLCHSLILVVSTTTLDDTCPKEIWKMLHADTAATGPCNVSWGLSADRGQCCRWHNNSLAFKRMRACSTDSSRKATEYY